MTDYLTNTNDLTTVANAIRTKGGTSDSLVFPNGFANAISAIPSGGSYLPGVLRSDATLVREWSSDGMSVADYEKNLPTNTTAVGLGNSQAVTMVSSAEVEKGYVYIIAWACLAAPVFKDESTLPNSTPLWTFAVGTCEMGVVNGSFFKTKADTDATTTVALDNLTQSTASNHISRTAVKQSAKTINIAKQSSSTSGRFCFSPASNVVTSTTDGIIFNVPPLTMQIISPNLTSAAVQNMDDVRVQVIARAYKLPAAGESVNGFNLFSLLDKVNTSAASASGDLVI